MILGYYFLFLNYLIDFYLIDVLVFRIQIIYQLQRHSLRSDSLCHGLGFHYHHKKVEHSYKNFQHPDNEILIQNMSKNVKYSGVIFTVNPENSSPYFKINYTKSSDTSLVTSGTSYADTLTFFRNSKIFPQEKFLKKLIVITKKIIDFTKKENLDIEFCVSKNNQINILQVRELKIQKRIDNNFD